MAKNKYYAVVVGRVPGIYTTWDEASAQVHGFPSAQFKSFVDRAEAERFMISFTKDITQNSEDAEAHAGQYHANIFVDGSYNNATDEYGYGVYIDDGDNSRIFVGKGQCQAGGRNIEGEVQAATIALTYAAKQYDSVTIYYDLEHIGALGEHRWKANTPYTKAYAELVDQIRHDGLAIHFSHVKGHTGVQGNEYVDKLAKIGCGIALTASEMNFISTLKNIEGFPSLQKKITPNKNVEGCFFMLFLLDCFYVNRNKYCRLISPMDP